MASLYSKSKYVAHQQILWGAVFVFTLTLAGAFFKDIARGLNGGVLTFSQVLVFAAVATGCCVIAIGFRERSKRYGNGRAGERAVAKVLKDLPPEYTIFQGVVLPGSRGDVDFVVVGPYGACTIEAKNHRSFFHLNLEKVLSQASREATRMKSYIKKVSGDEAWVNAFLVFSNPRIRIKPGIASGVTVVRLEGLNNAVLTAMNSGRVRAFHSEQLLRSLHEL